VRVLTATSTTQGDQPDDCCWTTEGELVSLPLLECSCPDCGCDRSFAGLDSHRATTTCVVADVPIDAPGLRRSVVRSLTAGGWLVDLPALDGELVDDVIARILEVAGSFPPGTVLARADGGVVVRRPAPA
jgi:hypothetical protein